MSDFNDTPMNEEQANTPVDEEQQTPNEQGGKDEQTAEEERLFTQSELNEIVKNRIARERTRIDKILDAEEFDKELIEREKNIELREMKADAKDTLDELGISNVFFDLINFKDRETMEKSIEIIKGIEDNYIEPMIEDAVKKRIAGVRPYVPMASSHSAKPESDIKRAFKHPNL